MEDALNMIQLAVLDDAELKCDSCQASNVEGKSRTIVLCQKRSCAARLCMDCLGTGNGEKMNDKGDWFCEECRPSTKLTRSGSMMGIPSSLRTSSAKKAGSPRESMGSSSSRGRAPSLLSSFGASKECGTAIKAKTKHLKEIKTFKLQNAHCYDPNEEQRIRLIVREGGEGEFEKQIQELGTSVLKKFEEEQQTTTTKAPRLFSSTRAPAASTPPVEVSNPAHAESE